jgi:hypothetical protein
MSSFCGRVRPGMASRCSSASTPDTRRTPRRYFMMHSQRYSAHLEDQLTNLLAHFKFDFKSFLDTIKESIARATVQKLILGPIAGSLSKLGGVFGKIGASYRGASRREQG